MKQAYIKAFNELKSAGAPVFVNEDNDRLGNFSLSAEENDDELWADFYCQEYGVFGVSMRVERILTSHGLFCEWENPGKLNVYIN